MSARVGGAAADRHGARKDDEKSESGNSRDGGHTTSLSIVCVRVFGVTGPELILSDLIPSVIGTVKGITHVSILPSHAHQKGSEQREVTHNDSEGGMRLQ